MSTLHPFPQLTEAAVRQNATENSFYRGESYLDSGAVGVLTLRGNTLQAEVNGSDVEPYMVSLEIDRGGIIFTDCTCPYDYDGWCKHIVATALKAIQCPDSLEERPTLERLLDRLDPVQTQRLVQSLVQNNPQLVEAVDRFVSLLVPASQPHSGQQPRRTTVDPAPIRSHTREILRDSLHYASEGGEEVMEQMEEQLQVLIDQAEGFSEQEDGNNAIVILEAITDVCQNEWDELEDYGIEFDEIEDALDVAWTHAILSADLTPEEKVDLQVTLENYQEELNGAFEMSLEALRQGWDDPVLLAVLQGDRDLLWEGESPYYTDDLAQIRLRILERQGRDEEYLSLAQAEGQTQLYLTKLSELGSVEEAIAAAQEQMSTAEEALALAQSLRERGAIEEALHIAQLGLAFEGRRQHNLAIWTSDLAEGLGDRPVAIAARTLAFKLSPSFASYRQIESLAGDTWPSIQADLLAALRNHAAWNVQQAQIDIYLHEGLLDEAIATINSHPYCVDQLVRRVLEAATAAQPDWVIAKSKVRAEDIMNRGKAAAYDEAAKWLELTRTAYLTADRRSEWADYRSQLMQIHGRKYKLMGFLNQSKLA
jgi:uncharacterized Zn finger protein